MGAGAGVGGAASLVAAGLGLEYDRLRLVRTTGAWLGAGAALRAEVVATLGGSTLEVELIGSSSVLGLLAKPIVDLAVGTTSPAQLVTITPALEGTGWIHRGDAGEDGGHVFVLEARPWFRVAHLHVVDLDGRQWRDYLRLRDLLRSDPDARRRYEAVKRRLATDLGDDRDAYTTGKSDVVASLLARCP